MKKLNLSLVAIFAMGTFAVAGGDIAPVEPVVEESAVVVPAGNFYLGLAYGYLSDNVTAKNSTGWSKSLWDENYNDIMVQAGYNFNQYIAIEGRYWFGLGDTTLANSAQNGTLDASIDAWGIYVKPQYPVTEALNVYALLGYGGAKYSFTVNKANGWSKETSIDSVDGFSWGLGASYAFTDNVAVFVDYTNIYDDSDVVSKVSGYTTDRTIDAWNFGVTYNF